MAYYTYKDENTVVLTYPPVNGTISGLDANSYALANQRPHNLLDGFDLWSEDATPANLLRVPFDTDGESIATEGSTIDLVDGYTWVARCPQLTKFGDNYPETTILNYPNPNLVKADKPQLFLYDASGVPKNIAYEDIDYITYTGNLLNISFADAEEYRKRNIITYLTARTPEQVVKIKKYINYEGA